jgi:hypothetical protein
MEGPINHSKGFAKMTTEERFNRIESVLDRVVDTQLQIDATMATLAESHVKMADAQAAAAVGLRELQSEMKDLKRQFEAYLNRRPQ